jgi:hypothetical protein
MNEAERNAILAEEWRKAHPVKPITEERREGMSRGGMGITWGAEHHSQGRLIVRMASIDPPEPPTCIKCFGKFFKESIRYTLLGSYHHHRVVYCELRQDKEIPERYRTGEPYPKSFIGLLLGILALRIRRICC